MVKSTIRIEFLTTNPSNMIKPIIPKMLSSIFVSRSARNAPMKLNGIASIITNGWRNEPNCDASTI